MQHDPLILTRFLERAAAYFPEGIVATHEPDAELAAESYADVGERSRRLASALADLGIGSGDRVATFARNSARHLELYFAVPGAGAVLHTLNVRLHPDQIAWIVAHAGDRVAFVDASLMDAFGPVRRQVPSLEHVVVMDDLHGDTAASGDTLYEDLIRRADLTFAWPDLNEDEAALLCYTSGTTGRPKGVLYSHRALVLHAFMVNQAEVIGLTSADTVLPVVPMFHANGWGFPHAATLAGAAQVFTGRAGADAHVVGQLVETRGVTVAAGVPTVWIDLLRHLETCPHDLTSIRMIKSGGAPLPPSLVQAFDERHGVRLVQGWGMTETSPLAAIASSVAANALAPSERWQVLSRGGRPVPGIRARVVDEQGAETPWDDASMGELLVRGNWVADGYFRADEHPAASSPETGDGWLHTGDVAVVDASGSIRLTDRSKDLVKSGGEWISTIELESALAGHPAVLESAVVAAPHERWQERPIAFVVLRQGASATADELVAFLAPRFPKWWLPDEVLFVGEIPKTSVGKFDKRALRARVRGRSTGG
ncbi:MAG TPA: long-chain fatty acid--CoA ligase [Actinomycetota bacterium]|nr:long-chain fatty acid--CoA ligase [Actinomycetota bacterium]